MPERDADDDIYVTRPYLPPFEEVLPYLQEIWATRVLTNGGPLHQRFEQRLCTYLGVDNISVFANGTLALMTALQSVALEGEVITTPFSFVATANAILWNRLVPVFADIDPVTLNIDPAAVEAAITPRTTAILAVHCYGHPCDTAALEKIARKHNLAIIYDAAHAFGVEDEGGSILRHGDLSVLSFHATKVFNTFEGVAIISADLDTKTQIDRLKNFGHVGETSVVAAGINGKMSELGAAVGLAQLDHVDGLIDLREAVDRRYREGLSSVEGVRCLDRSTETRANFSYFPILVDDRYPLERDELVFALRAHGIYPRRYFYPLIVTHPMYRAFPSAAPELLPVAQEAASRVLCLPIYPDLPLDDVDRIIDIVAGA